MGNQRDDIFTLFPETLAIPAGATAVINPLPGQMGMLMKYVSGGSILIQGATFLGVNGNSVGSSYAINQQYILGTAEILSIDMSGLLYVQATGSTSVISLLRTLDSRPFNITAP